FGAGCGVLVDWGTVFSNCAIAVVQGPACAETAHRTQAAPATTTVNRRFSSNRGLPSQMHLPSLEISTRARSMPRVSPAQPRGRVDDEMGGAPAVLRC